MPDNSIKYLQAHYLVHFLNYTTLLEHTIVNRAVESIIHNRGDMGFGNAIRTTGLKIYTDEGYHAQFSAELSEQIATHFNISKVDSARIKNLREILDNCESNKYHLVLFLVAFVSETIIASELANLAQHKLITPVYHAFRDHLHDEARHAKYFSDCFALAWKNLESADRSLAAHYIPKIMKVFCMLDEPWLAISLESCPTPLANLDKIILESRELFAIRLPLSSSNTIKAIRRTDLLDTQEFIKLFDEKWLKNGL